MANVPFIGRAFKALSGPILQAGGDISAVLFRAGQDATKFAESLTIPPELTQISAVLDKVATAAEQFGSSAKKSFDSVREDVQRTTTTADGMTQPLEEARTKTGELVQVSGGVGVMFDSATGKILAMNRELFGTLNLVRQINAEAVRPVQ
jgi:methyl-accepting chemotaxis protein